jgi:hypothetical protein
VVRSQAANDFSAATCLVTDSSGTSASDAAAPGQIFYCLVRAENSCGGSLGTDSSGAPRSTRACVGPGG